MKRVLVISTSYFPTNGGQEIGLERLILGMSDLNQKFMVLTPRFNSYKKEELVNGVEVYRYKTLSIKYFWRFLGKNINNLLHVLSAFVAIPFYILRLKPDKIIIYFLYPSGLAGIFYSRLFNIKHVSYFGGSDIAERHLILGAFAKNLLSREKTILVTSTFLKRLLSTQYSIQSDRIKIIPYGFNFNDFACEHKDITGRYELLAVQRLVLSKRTKSLVVALGECREKGLKNFHLNIVGDGPERGMLEALAARMKLDKYISFIGNIPANEVASFYKQSHIFLFPSEIEGFGIVLLEALASKNIVIASNSTAIPEIINDGETGVLYNPRSSSDLSDKLIYAMENYNDLKHLNEAGTKKAKEYDIKIVSREFIKEINAL